MGTPVPSTNKADRHDIIEILLKVALNTITLYKLWKLVEKYLLNQTVSMYLFDELHKWDYSTWKVRPQMVSEFRKITNGWNLYLYGNEKRQ